MQEFITLNRYQVRFNAEFEYIPDTDTPTIEVHVNTAKIEKIEAGPADTGVVAVSGAGFEIFVVESVADIFEQMYTVHDGIMRHDRQFHDNYDSE